MPKSKKKKSGTKLDRAGGLIAITLGGETRSVAVLNVRESAGFRKAAAPLFEPLAEMVLKLQQSTAPANAVVAAGPGLTAKEKKAVAEKAAQKSSMRMLPKIMPWLMSEGLDRLVELPYQYAPELEDLRDKATDSEEIAAGSAVLGLVFPLFVTLLLALPTMLSGMGDDIA